MSRLSLIKKQKELRKKRVARLINGTSERPRLSISISNKHITAQIIDDTKSQTLVYVSTVGKKTEGNFTDKAVLIGAEVAKKAKLAKITKVVFDRGAKNYHGRVKALADAAREGGLEF
jgi:large subunit ribosomal protein L18